MTCYSNSLMPQPTKIIKTNKDGLVVVNGANQLATLGLCGFKSLWSQYYTNRLELGPSANEVEIDFGMMGTDVTFISLKATYSASEKDLNLNYLEWYFIDNPLNVYPMGELMILTGNDAQRIKPIIISNPNNSYGVQLDILAATTSIVNTVYTTITNPTENLVVQGVTLASLITDQQGISIKVVVDSDIKAYINMQTVSNIELSGLIVILDDSAIGKIYLEFTTEAEAAQGYSALNWLIQDLANNTLPVSADITAPVITWAVASGYTIDISLSPYFDVFTKTDAVNLITSVIDDRDGVLTPDESHIMFSNLAEEIETPGTYIILISIDDTAGNTGTSQLTINFV